jgi:hypothetical protein
MGYEHEDEHEDEHKDMHSCDTNLSPTAWELNKHCLLLSTPTVQHPDFRIEAQGSSAAGYIILCRASRGSVRPRLRCCAG